MVPVPVPTLSPDGSFIPKMEDDFGEDDDSDSDDDMEEVS